MKTFYKILLSLPFILHCSKADKWDGHIQIKQDIIYVHNTSNPIYRSDNPIHVTKVFTLGGSENQNLYMLSNPADIVTDLELNTFVSDVKEDCIFKFDKEGQFLDSMKGQGQGPGELYGPAGIEYANGELFIWETGNMRFSVFSKTLEFHNLFKCSQGYTLTSFVIPETDDNSLYVASVASQFAPSKSKNNIYKYTIDGKPLTSFGQLIPLGMTDQTGQQYAFPHVTTFANQILCAFQTPYQIRSYSPDGMLTQVIEKNEPQVNELKKCSIAYAGYIHIPQIKIINILTVPDEFIVTVLEDQGTDYQEKYNNAAQRKELRTEIEPQYYYDFFDASGRFLFRYNPPSSFGQIVHFDHSGHFYTKYLGEDGVFVKKFSYQINGQL